MDDNSSNISGCVEKYDNSRFYGLLYFRCVLSIISVLFILSMLAIMILYKKYRFFTQRLILYLAISTLTYQTISALDVSSIKAYSDQDALNYCILIGVLTQIVIWCPVMATTVITFDIFVRAVLKKSTERLEILYVLLIFVLPALINWIPLVDMAYGPAQYFCWIKDEDIDKNCDSDYLNGIIFRAVFFFIPCYILVAFMIISLVITIISLSRSRKNYSGKFDPQAIALKKQMELEIRPILYYPIIFIVATIFSVIMTIYNAANKSNNEVGYIIFAVILSISFRLQGVFITLVFTLDPETRKKLNVKEIKAAFNNFLVKDEDKEYPAEYNARSDSVVSNSNKVN